MNEPSHVLEPGTKIVTHPRLGSAAGMSVNPLCIYARKPNQKGEIFACVPGHGGDVYLVQHEGSYDVGAYAWNEFELDVSPTLEHNAWVAVCQDDDL